MASLAKLVSDLQFAYKQPNHNNEDLTKLFTKFQVALIKSYNSLKNESEFISASQGLEYGAKLYIDTRESFKFERVFQQLSQFYSFRRVCEQSNERQFLIGLYLTYLLTKNRLDDFHTELELLTDDDLKNEFIAFSMKIETYMMDGSYNKILAIKPSLESKNDVRYDKFTLFLSNLENTVRNEIADSLEAVHESMPVKKVCEMLRLSNIKVLEAWIAQQNAQAEIDNDVKDADNDDIEMDGVNSGVAKRNWTLNREKGVLVFEREEQQQQAIDAMETAKDMLEFTGHIETIV